MIIINLLLTIAVANLIVWVSYTVGGEHLSPDVQQLISPADQGIAYSFLFLCFCSLPICFMLWHGHFKNIHRKIRADIERYSNE